MTRYLIPIFGIIFLFLASCEDKEKSRNNNQTPAITSDVVEIDSMMESQRIVEDTINQNDNEEEFIVPEKPIIQEELIPFLTEYGKKNPENRVRIITRFGDIEVRLFEDTHLHRANFIYLVKHNYFDDTFFHRVAEGFVIQGGNSDNPDTSNKRNSIGNYLIPSEFDAGHRHTRGAFAAAKYADQNVSKASSPFEFYIVQSHRGAHHLDNDHTVFGRVTNGMDVVDEIAQQEVGEGEWPNHNIYLEVEIID